MSTQHPRRFLAIVLIAAALAPAARAQSAPAQPAPTDEKKVVVEGTKNPDESAALELEAVEVTGSRIRTLGQEATAIPVFSINQVELERRGVTRLADIRWAIPQLGASVGFNDNLQNSGTSRAQTVGTSFNLRGLGGNSTLVLVDGRRVPHTGQEAPGGAGGREDFSVDGIPVSAIERIDILPEGAGAVYGSEAIAGVVNIILKKNYSGGELNVTYDNTFKSDVGQLTVSLTAGRRSGKWRTFFTASLEQQNGLASRDRWFSATADNRVFGAATAQAFYLSQVASGPGSLSSTSSPQNAGQPNLPGQTTNIVGLPAGSNGSTAANGAFSLTVPVQYDPNRYSTSIDPARRRSLVFNADYDFARWARFYVETRWSRFDNYTTGTPPTLSVSLPAGYPGNPFGSAVFLRKVFWDLPLAHTRSSQENQGLNLGVRGDLPGDWRYDAAFAFARNVVSDISDIGSSFNFTLLNAGINNADPAQRPILAYDSSAVRNPNPAGLLEGYFPKNNHQDTTDTADYTFVADGTIWSWWGGDIKGAFGGEAGRESVRFSREQNITTPTFVLTRPFRRTSTAAFAEVTLPLVSGERRIPFVHRLEAGGAVRSEDYTDSGSVVTPTYRALYQPYKWLTFRASRAEGFKPVRLYDLLGPVTTGTTTLTTTSNVRDNRRGGELVLGTFTRSFGGNPTLKPEESVSKNAGVVLDVPGHWFKGLSFSADYYQIAYTDRSGGPGTQVLFDFFPERVTRAAPTAADTAAGFAGLITTWDATNINLAGVKTKGWDFRATYSRRFGFGDVQVSVAYSDPNVIFTKSTPAAVPSSSFGHQPSRVSGTAFWGRGPWEAGVSVIQQHNWSSSGGILNRTPEILEFNPRVSYNFGQDARFGRDAQNRWARWLADTKVAVTVINALNHDPKMEEAAAFRVNMDPRLRRYILTLTKKI